MSAAPGIAIASADLRVVVNPRVGGTITEVRHLASGLSVLGTAPWDAVDASVASLAARDEVEWLTRFTGGWPLLFPNGGDACSFGGVFHGFHGEASIAPWEFSATAGAITLRRRFFSVPVTMERTLSVDGDVLVLRERARVEGERAVEAMWVQHATFGSDLLDGPVEITSNAARASVDPGYDPPHNPLRLGASGDWPIVPGKDGPVDLSRPVGPLASQAYLHDFDAGAGKAWAAMRRLDGALGAVLSWDAAVFPAAWLWCELGGTIAPPWHGLARMIGIEPATTMPGGGIADASARGSRLMTLQPGVEQNVEVRLHVLAAPGPIVGVDTGGRAVVR